METFKIEIRELLSRIVEVEATSIEEAISKIHEMYRKEEIVLDSSNLVSTDIEILHIGQFPEVDREC
jgi:hypothetical protein